MAIHVYEISLAVMTVDLKPEDVFKACDALEAQGKAITGYAVRKHIGRGSTTTVQKYTDVWKLSTPVGFQASGAE